MNEPERERCTPETKNAGFFGLARSISYMWPDPGETQVELRELVAAFDVVYPVKP